MTDFRVKDISIFSELTHNIELIEGNAPEQLSRVKESLEGLKRDIYVDVLQTREEIEEAKKNLRMAEAAAAMSEKADLTEIRELRQKISHLSEKLQRLESAESQANSLIMKFNQTQNKFEGMIKNCCQAKDKLMAFDHLARQYLNMSGNTSQKSGGGKAGAKYQNDSADIRLVGDTYHMTKKNQLQQSDLDRLENQLKSSNTKGNRISIDKITPSDFSLLEKNGYTIKEIKPNDYSAFKNIDR